MSPTYSVLRNNSSTFVSSSGIFEQMTDFVAVYPLVRSTVQILKVNGTNSPAIVLPHHTPH
jgi:hypothetical protein